MKIKLNDKEAVISGKDKGKTGKVMRVLSKQNSVVIEKINLKTKHVKKTPQKAGEKIQFEGPVNVSNVMLICPNCSKKTRVGYHKLENGKKQRICKKCKESIDKSAPKKS